MTDTFNTTELDNHEVLVEGNNGEQAVLDSTQWDAIKMRGVVTNLQGEFDTELKQFYAPLLEKADELNAKLAALEDDDDEMSYVVVREGVEGVEPVSEIVEKLTRDSKILRLIEAGKTDRLRWVGNAIVIRKK